ncbi:MAG: hypothetical protein AB2693_33220 [Candidatus Thiodiazotropha sp.]
MQISEIALIKGEPAAVDNTPAKLFQARRETMSDVSTESVEQESDQSQPLSR